MELRKSQDQFIELKGSEEIGSWRGRWEDYRGITPGLGPFPERAHP